MQVVASARSEVSPFSSRVNRWSFWNELQIPSFVRGFGLCGTVAPLASFIAANAFCRVWASVRLTDRLSEVPTPVERLSILEALLTQLLRQAKPRSDLVGEAIHLFRDSPLTVTQCARSVGVSERRLSRVFCEQIGISPKMWCRIRRFQTAVRALHDGADLPWAE
jgi:AraC-like DNA-binding protein